MTDSDPRSQVYRNKKTGYLYVVLHWDAFLFDEPHGSYVVLRNLENGLVCIRSKEKFLGRNYDFECIPKDELLAAVRGLDAH